MITGLWIEMSSITLQELLTEKAGYHDDKARRYREQADNLAREIGTAPVGQSNDPTASLRASQRAHENKYTFFAMLAEHIIPHETYRLSQEDCIRLELYERYFG